LHGIPQHAAEYRHGIIRWHAARRPGALKPAPSPSAEQEQTVMPLPEDPRAYMKLASTLRGQIRDGTWKPGDHVPSITALSGQTGHSRQTAGRAMQVLLMRTPGLGYFVCMPEGSDYA
jgi:hypothetical protein